LYIFFIAFNYLYSQKGQSTNENRLSKSNRVKNNANDDNNNDSYEENSSNSTKNTRNTKTISNSSSKNLSDSSKHNGASRSHHHHHHQQQKQQQQPRTHRSAHHNSNSNTRKHQHQHHHYTNSKNNKMSEETDANDVDVEGPESNLMSKCKNLTNIYKSESAKAFRDVKGKIESKLKSLANNSKLSSSLVKMSAHESSSRKNAKHADAEKPKMTRQQVRDLKIVHPTPRRDVKKSTSNNRQRYSSDEVDEQEEDEETYKEVNARKKQDFESPTRPAPPKRPPPPRPSSPTTSFSNYSFTDAHRHQSTSHGKSKVSAKTPRKTQNSDRDHSISPQSLNINKKRENSANCQLPPRPPLPTTSHSTSTSKTKSSSNKNNEDFLSDCQIYEFEELKLRNGKKNATNNKKNLGLIREENSKESRNHKMSNHSSSTPSLTLSSQSPSPELAIEKVSRRNHSHQRVNNNERKKS
jgi:trimeric autotransporter adhesin